MTAPDAWAQIEKAKAQLQETVDQVGRQADDLSRMNAELQASTIEKWSPRREVRVVIGPDGLIQDLEFSAGAPQLTPLALARAVQHAHDAAVRELHERAARLAQEHLQDQPEMRNWLLDSYTSTLGKFGPDEAEPGR